jgi:hypothetical protein
MTCWLQPGAMLMLRLDFCQSQMCEKAPQVQLLGLGDRTPWEEMPDFHADGSARDSLLSGHPRGQPFPQNGAAT